MTNIIGLSERIDLLNKMVYAVDNSIKALLIRGNLNDDFQKSLLSALCDYKMVLEIELEEERKILLKEVEESFEEYKENVRLHNSLKTEA